MREGGARYVRLHNEQLQHSKVEDDDGSASGAEEEHNEETEPEASAETEDNTSQLGHPTG